jgi:hypothetical protein
MNGFCSRFFSLIDYMAGILIRSDKVAKRWIMVHQLLILVALSDVLILESYFLVFNLS